MERNRNGNEEQGEAEYCYGMACLRTALEQQCEVTSRIGIAERGRAPISKGEAERGDAPKRHRSVQPRSAMGEQGSKMKWSGAVALSSGKAVICLAPEGLCGDTNRHGIASKS